MRKKIMFTLLSGMLVFCNMNSFAVKAEEGSIQKEQELTEEALPENKPADAPESRSDNDYDPAERTSGKDVYVNADTELTGEAYAVLTSSGDLTFFRSNNTYTNGSYTRAVDIMGNSYTGTVYSGIESKDYKYMEDAPWYSKYVKRVKVASGQTIRPINTAYWFHDQMDITSIDLTGLDTGNVTNMQGMFWWCENLTSLKLTGLDTSAVTEMQLMFSNCYLLKTVDLSGFNTANVRNMSGMFSECSALTSLDLSSFDTRKVTDMSSIFSGCNNLTDLNLSSFHTGNVTSMAEMFYECFKLKTLDLSGFDTGKVTSMSMMFYCCSSLTSLDLSAFDTRSVTSMSTMFGGTQNIKTVKLGTGFTKWVDNAVLIGPMWINIEAGVYKTREELCAQYPSHAADWAGTWEQISVPDAYAVLTDEGDLVFFLSCNSYTNGNNITAEDIFGHTYTGTVYAGIGTLAADQAESVPWHSRRQEIKSVMVAYNQIFEPVDMSYWFFECSNLSNADLSRVNTGNVTAMKSLFSGCRKLTSLDLSSFDTGKVDDMTDMFNSLTRLQEVKLGPGFTVWKNNSYLPEGDWENKEKGLKFTEKELYEQYPDNAEQMAGTWRKEISEITYAYAVYTEHRLVFFRSHDVYENNTQGTAEDINGQTYTGTIYSGIEELQAGSVDDIPWSANRLIIYRIISFNDQIIKPVNMANWFTGFDQVNEIDLSGFDTSAVTDMSNLFAGASRVETLDLSGFNTENVTSMKGMFSSCFELENLDLSSFNTKNVADMSRMFNGCIRNQTFDVSSFDTSNVTDMNNMFGECSVLKTLDLRSFNTEKVTDMNGMFNSCYELENLDLSSFNTKNVTDMSMMFYYCNKLKAVDLSGFHTGNVTDMNNMFYSCFELNELDVSSFDTSNVRNMNYMFAGCKKVKELDVSHFDTRNVSSLKGMFHTCSSLNSLDLTSFNTGAVNDMTDMFRSLDMLWEVKLGLGFTVWKNNSYLPKGSWMNKEEGLKLSETELYEQYPKNAELMAGKWERMAESEGYAYAVLNDEGELIFFRSYEVLEADTNEEETIQDLFGNEYYGYVFTNIESASLEELPWQNKKDHIRKYRVAERQTIVPVSIDDWFRGCENLTEVDMTGIDAQNITDMSYLFAECTQLQTVNLSMLNTENVKDMSSLFLGCTGLESVNLKGMDTSNVTNMDSMFSICINLKELDLSGINTEKVTDMDNMFSQCENLEELDLSSFNTANVVSMTHMFGYCESLKELGVSMFDTSNVRKMGAMFAGCKGLVSLDLTSFDTSKVTEMNMMFFECTALEDLDLSSFNTSNVMDMNQMFDVTKSLRYIHLGPEFTVWHVYTYLPEGKWTNYEINKTLTDAQLREQYPANAEKWAGVWEFNGRAYAVIQEDGEFVFFRSCYTYDDAEYAEAVDLDGSRYAGTVFYGFEDNPITQEWDAYWDAFKNQIKTIRVAEGEIIEPQSLSFWFSDCRELTAANLTGLDLSVGVSMEALFSGCEKLENVELGSLDTSPVYTTGSMFKDCVSLKELDLSNFDMGRVERMEDMFTGSGLEKITLGPKFTKWLDDSYLPKGFWQKKELDLTLTEKELYEQYPSNAAEWAGEWTKKPDINSILIYGSSLGLEGKIEINFFLDIPEAVIDQLTVVMSLNDTELRIPAAEGIDRVVNNHQLKAYTCPAAAKEMRDQVILSVEDSDGHKVALTKDDEDYTEGYAYSAADYFAKAEEAGQEKTKKLTRVLNDYGKYTQIYFNYNVTEEVNNVTDVSAVTLEALDPYKAIMTAKGITGLTYVGGSAMLDDAIGYRLYFNLENGHDISEFSFTIDNKPVTPVLRSGTQYYIEKPDIAAKDLGIMNTVLITGGTEMMAVRYSALSYAYTALSLTGDNRIPLQNMCRSMYLYNQQAIEYFNS